MTRPSGQVLEVEVGELRAELVGDLRAGRRRHLLELPDEAPGLAGDVGQSVRSEDEQRDQGQHGELRQPDVKHWSSLP